MKSTDQLTAMQMMAVDPLRYVVAPRFIGGILAMPLLAGGRYHFARKFDLAADVEVLDRIDRELLGM